jgi:hypothetical protein
VYSLNGLYENDRQLSTSYHVACILEKK